MVVLWGLICYLKYLFFLTNECWINPNWQIYIFNCKNHIDECFDVEIFQDRVFS